MQKNILLVECVDEKGLIYKITEKLFSNGLNIISNDEFVDRKSNRFFMRTEFSGSVESKVLMGELRSVLPEDANLKIPKQEPKKIIIFATKEHHCLGDLLLRHAHGELNAKISLVLSNHEILRPLTEKFGIPFHRVPHESNDRKSHERKILEVLDRYEIDYLVLAKYMRILTADFVECYRNQIINIHHSFLPAFTGAKPYRQAFDRGVKIIGATAHFVSEQLDRGPIIAQSVMDIEHSHSVRDMVQSGRDIEKIVLAKAVRLAFEDRIFVSGNKTIIFD